MRVWTPSIAAGLIAGLFCAQALAPGASPARLPGAISGLVLDSGGVPQMGATVLLFNRYDRLLERTLTDETGGFSFGRLDPDSYTVRVTLASFLPALKENIVVQPGAKSLLSVNLASVISSIELIYPNPGQRALMSDDWKWVLRTSTSTRPVLRFGPHIDLNDPHIRSESSSEMFTDTHGLVRVSAGDRGALNTYGSEPDLGTAFALATSIYGNNEVQFSGNFNMSAATGAPSGGFRTTFSRDTPGGGAPEVSVTMRQLYLPTMAGLGFIGGQGNSPALRTMSASFSDRSEVGEGMTLEYGFSMESVAFLDRLNYFTPYARLTKELGDTGSLQFSYLSGLPPAELITGHDHTGLQDDLTAVGVFPRLSILQGRARVQRSKSYEVGYHRVAGSRKYAVSIQHETMVNAAVTMQAVDRRVPFGSDVLPDLFGNTSIFNGGDYTSLGLVASATQSLGDFASAAVLFGSDGVLLSGDGADATTPDELRTMIRSGRRHWVGAKVSGAAPVLGTRVTAGYQWSNVQAITPGHLYLTQQVGSYPGLNMLVRQPIPGPGGLGGRLELTADLRNLLAEGYVPLNAAGGRKAYFMQAPRSLRGGLSFIF